MALRIIAGRFKGRKLRSVPGTKTRPTSGRIREAIFSILAVQVRGAKVLDLFAGTGAFGVEALSRGAESVFFIDNDNDSISVLKYNIKSISLESYTKILKWDPTINLNCLRFWQPAFNLVFMDPPYNKNLIAITLQNLHNSGSMAKGSHIVVEHSHQDPIPKGQAPFVLQDQRRYGKTLVSFFNYVV